MKRSNSLCGREREICFKYFMRAFPSYNQLLRNLVARSYKIFSMLSRKIGRNLRFTKLISYLILRTIVWFDGVYPIVIIGSLHASTMLSGTAEPSMMVVLMCIRIFLPPEFSVERFYLFCRKYANRSFNFSAGVNSLSLPKIASS